MAGRNPNIQVIILIVNSLYKWIKRLAQWIKKHFSVYKKEKETKLPTVGMGRYHDRPTRH